MRISELDQQIGVGKGTATLQGQALDLTQREWELLELLVQRVVSALQDHARGEPLQVVHLAGAREDVSFRLPAELVGARAPAPSAFQSTFTERTSSWLSARCGAVTLALIAQGIIM